MSALWSWLALPLVGRFGRALVHFVWQGAAIGVTAALSINAGPFGWKAKELVLDTR